MNIILKKTSVSAEETEKIGFEFAKLLSFGDCLAMKGDLGAGKTAFVRGMAKYLCPKARVQSPTYTIVNSYGGKIPLYHFDMYRIDGEESLYSTGFFDYLDADGVCLAEWCENIRDFIPENAVRVTISKLPQNENARKITIE